MTDIPEIRMAERCATCAFRPGTPASSDPLTSMLARLCVATCEPFECHEGDRPALCSGFVDAVTVKMARGDYERLPAWKREIYRTCSEAIADAQAGVTVDLPARIKAAMALMADEDGRDSVRPERNDAHG